MGLLPNPKRAAQNKIAEVKGKAKEATVGKVQKALAAPIAGIATATCCHCHITLPKIKMRKVGFSNNNWSCRNNKKCADRKGWMHQHSRRGKSVEYPSWLTDD